MIEKILCRLLSWLQEITGTRWGEPEINSTIILFILGFLVADIIRKKIKQRKER